MQSFGRRCEQNQIEAMTLADRIVVMHGGRIQQQGTPEELFKSPSNKFVAGFLGSPPMNFLTAELRQEGDLLYLEGTGFKLLCDKQVQERLNNHGASDIEIGIRPSDLQPDEHASDDASFDINVVVSEYIGAQSVLIGDCICSIQVLV